eukprot:scaffold5688_cov188-Prasinococcus_capsulatus_cf.AAC.1
MARAMLYGSGREEEFWSTFLRVKVEDTSNPVGPAVEAWWAHNLLEISERVRGERSDVQPEEPWVRGC